MIVNFSLESLFAKFVAGLLTLALFGVLVCAALWYLVIGTLSDERIAVPPDVLNASTQYFPNSPRLQARLAAAEMQGVDRDLAKAEAHIRQAIALLPGEYNYRLLLASILEAQGNREEAEKSYRDSLALAPNYLEVHWRLANNLVRQGKVKESLDHFRYATGKNLGLLPNAYDLIWNVSGGSIEAINSITDAAPRAQILLAHFLAKQAKFSEAAKTFRQIDRKARKIETETPPLINELIAANQLPLARDLWSDTLSDTPNQPQPLIWNGSLEQEINAALPQFDWIFQDSEYARVTIDPQTARTGTSSLRVYFPGKDTARVSGTIKQILLLNPGKRYRLECYYKTRDLISPMGPRVVITDLTSQTVIAGTDPLPEGTQPWQPIGFEFVAPANLPAALIQIQRIPKYSYDEPTRGYVWFDEFILKEQ